MYVWYGTNEYNFEKLPNPPAYEPTTCHKCGRMISLGEDGYSSIGGHYFCDNCAAERIGGTFPSQAKAAPSEGQHDTGLRVVRDEDADEDLSEPVEEVPPAYRDRFDDIVELTDKFCDEHLNEEYKEYAREMAAEVCQEGSPARKGKAEGWAAGIVYSLGRVNFLDDPSQTPHMKSTQIAEGFGVSAATMQAKARVIREGLDLMPFHPDWTLPSRMDDNPLVWMLKVNGFLVDIRMAPRDAQVAAYKQGLIPYIPADRVE
jgi:hypothetical protein